MTVTELEESLIPLRKLKEHKLEFEIESCNYYDQMTGANINKFVPVFSMINSLEQLRLAFSVNGNHSRIHGPIVEKLRGIKPANCVVIQGDWVANKGKDAGNVKYYDNAVLGNIRGYTSLHQICGTVNEEQVGDRTYRTLSNGVNVLLCVNEQDPIYVAVDKGHILISNNTNNGFSLITNLLTLDVNIIIMALHLVPNLATLIPNKFINGNNTKLLMMQLEKAMPAKLQANYREYKQLLTRNFEQYSQKMMVNQLKNSEVGSVTINDIKFTHTKAEYNEISIEAPELAKKVFAVVNPTEHFDIYRIISQYCTLVEKDFEVLATVEKAGVTAFSEAKSFKLKINGIPLEVSVTTENTRRYINGQLIKKDELLKTLFRASCYQDAKQFNNFLGEVSHMSLQVRDVLANGLPVKVTFDPHTHLRGYTPEAFVEELKKFPRLKFEKSEGKFYFIVDKETKAHVSKFVELINKIEQVNFLTNDGWVSGYYGGDKKRDGAWCTDQVRQLLIQYTVPTVKKTKDPVVQVVNQASPLTAAMLDKVFAAMESDRQKAIKRSEELLNDIIKDTGAKVTRYKDIEGYEVTGTLRKYFVQKGTNTVYNAETGRSICIVDNQHNVGVGFDATAARLLALKNDSVSINKIGTLRNG